VTAIQVTVVGNLTADPELRYTATGVPVASFTVASNERFKDGTGEWQDGPTSFVRCNAWRDLAEHAAESLAKGDRAVVTGTLRQRDYEAQDGTKRTVWEVAVSEVGAALRYATVKIAKARRDSVPVPEDPWAGTDAGTAAGPPPGDEPPF
jgi:single-strand DNA-binding protein